ncbi:AsmA-like C-terminal region-containing protein [Aestuariivivens marinum]|uniref:AsmA-like C-terminal region-containing protein n=1 Tax=Aestuariivivens marinum TaxID=2913555 RepID=UPI001F560308|nr:AsmA-like C-terminal region-containing protein [Aestuariivivens marinum]
MKKNFKIIGITLLIVLGLLIAIPFAFQGKITDMVKKVINDNLNAKVEFNDVSLSFIRSFPKAHVNVNDLVITNFEPFKDETLATAKGIAFSMSIKELFKDINKEPIVINSISVDEVLLALKTDEFGNNNYDITKTDNTVSPKGNKNNFALNIEDYSINNSALTYIDEGTNVSVYITKLNHAGHGIFSSETSELETTSEANVSLSIDSTNYLSNNTIKLDALIGLDLSNNTYTFKENQGFINELPIEFKGHIQQLDNGQDIDITFENPESDFKNFLAVIPKVYSKNIENVQTTGDFKIKGTIKGLSSEETIPNFDISITSNNASFKYPDLPKRVSNINISTFIKNTTGNVDDTFVDIKTLDFIIDGDVFKSSATLKNLTKNMLVNANINGVLNLANIAKAYPITLETPLTGILRGNFNTAFDMKAIETNAYARIKNSGSVSITDFIFSSEAIANPIHITEANMDFNTGTVSLNNFKVKTGDSDLNATGTIKNLLGFLLSDGNLQGDFKVNSSLFKVSDFMTENVATQKKKIINEDESLKIPAFLDCTINANANTVVYDNLNLKDVKGTLVIKDQKASLYNLTSSMFDGALALAGDVTTKGKTPNFNLNLNANDFDIAKSFNGMELLQNLAPIAKLLQGKLNTNITLKGNLDNDFSPVLSSVTGNALAELLSTKFNTDQSKLISSLEGALNFIDFDTLNLNDLKTQFEFADGKVAVKPFKLKYEDIAIEISGTHGFDKTVDYKAIFNVPTKYLGSDVNRLIGKIDMVEANSLSIPVTAKITGSFTNPTVKTDLSSGVKNLTQQLIKIEKQKLLNQSKDKVKNMLGDIVGANKTKTDSIKKLQDNSVKDILSGIIKPQGTQTDSIPTDSTKTPEKKIKNVLGGLLGGQKKTQKDTVN